MSISRRRLLATIVVSGAAAVIAPDLAAPGSRNAYAASQDGGPFDAWAALARQRPGDPVALVAAAILAANPHDTQPWIFEVRADQITLRADQSRNLGSFDPFRREMWIGLGCAVEIMVRAGPSLGFQAVPQLVEQPGQAMPRVELALARRAPAADGALSVIAGRRTNRAAYTTAPVAGEVQSRLLALGREGRARTRLFAATSPLGKRFAADTIAATEWITADRTMAEDSHRWFRGNAAEIARHRDGVSVRTSGLSPLMVFLGEHMPPPDLASEGRYWVEGTRRQVGASALFGVITVDDLHDRGQQIDAGRVWQRMHLEITRAGLAAQPLNQLPEVVDRLRQLGRPSPSPTGADAFAGDDGHVTFCFRAGHAASQVPHSARRPLTDVVRRL